MKIRESGMHEEEERYKFFDPTKTLRLLGLSSGVQELADFGCGYGSFTIPAAKIISGKIYAFDIEPDMIEIVKWKAQTLNLGNVETVIRDFVSEGSRLQDASVDFVFLLNILHLEKPESLLSESYRIIKQRGKLGLFIGTMTQQRPEAPNGNSPQTRSVQTLG